MPLAPYRALFSGVSFVCFSVSVRTGVFVGAGLGSALAVALYLTVPAYHDYVVSAWSNPWLLAGGFAVGAFLAWRDRG